MLPCEEKHKAKAKVDLMEHSNSLPTNELREQMDKLYNQTKYFIPPPENLIAKTL